MAEFSLSRFRFAPTENLFSTLKLAIFCKEVVSKKFIFPSEISLDMFRGNKCEESTPQEESPCKMIKSAGDICGVSRKDREQDALAKVNNRIFFMGLTKYGYQQPIRESVNPCLRDKCEGRPSLDQFLPDPNVKDIDYGQLAEKFHNIDIYSGLVDGKNYGRVNRVVHQKLRHARNPHGTEERFCTPMTDSMNYGWWIRDQKALDQTKWYAVSQRFPQVRGEITKFVDEMALHTPNFILF